MHKNVKFLIFSAFLTFTLSTIALAGYSLAADTVIDATAPVISDGYPNGSLLANTTEAELSVTTNKNAICRFSRVANTDFNSMSSFSDSPVYSLNHWRLISGLVNGNSYTYYVRCQDLNGHTNVTDYVITFSVESSTSNSCLSSSEHGTSTPGLTCCDSTKVVKQNYPWQQNWVWYNCCSSTQCADDGVCRDSGTLLPGNSAVICRNGDWVNNTIACTSFTYSGWSNCSNGVQTRTVTQSSPTGCTGGTPVISQACDNPNVCTKYLYSTWSACSSAGTQTRTQTGLYPSGCTLAGANIGNPILSQNCNYTAPTCTNFTYTPWSTCNANGVQAHNILTSAPANCTGGSPVKFQKCTPACSSFSYKAWSACQSNNLQYREVATTSPAVCSGGTPVLIQSCTYVSPVITDTSSNPTNSTPTANSCVITPAGGNFFDPTDITITCGANVASASWQWGKYGTPTSFTRNTTVSYPADKTNTLFVKYSYHIVVRGVTYTKTGSAYRTFAAKQSYCKLTPDSGTYAYDTTITITCGHTVTKGTYQWDNGSTTEFTSPATITYSANRNHKLKVTFTYTYTYNNQTLTKTATFNKFYNLKRCADSEIGAVYQLKGNSVYTVNTTVKNYSDTCSGSYLLEYYCGPGHSVKFTRTKCLYGCSNGACVAPGN